MKSIQHSTPWTGKPDEPPGGMAKFAVHSTQNSGRQQGSECITDEVTAREHRGPNSELLPGVPLTQKEQCAREEGGFHEAQKESCEQSSREATKKS